MYKWRDKLYLKITIKTSTRMIHKLPSLMFRAAIIIHIEVVCTNMFYGARATPIDTNVYITYRFCLRFCTLSI